jgi:hypothetical protein
MNDHITEQRDRMILRDLASEVAELAARPVEDQKKALWYEHNSLKPTRPLIFCDPENGWNEIITPSELRCQSDQARHWEFILRKEVFWGSRMNDDRVVLPEFTINHVYTETDWGMRETRIGGEGGGAYSWIAPFNSYDLLEKLSFPKIKVDEHATNTLLEIAHELFEGLLTVRLRTSWWWTLGLTWTLVNLRGLEQIMLDMMDNPQDLHRLMAFLRDGTMARLEFLEKSGLLSLNNDGAYVGSGGFGWTNELPQPDFSGIARTNDLWGFAESQETVGVSPVMYEEFIFPYQMSLLSKFGLNCYGCCEPLDKRWYVVQRLPRLRRISVSPWANVSKMASFLGNKYIFSWKPPPSDLAAYHFDDGMIRHNLREGFKELKRQDCRVEVIMKDNHTIANDPRRVIQWVQIAKEEAEA